MISLIAAIGKNNELGKANDLLWNLPLDMKHFRKKTSGKTVIMGQRTFESLGTSKEGVQGKPLPNRRNIVLNKDPNYFYDGVEIAHSIDEALDMVKNESEEVFIIGGGQVYKIFIEKAGKLYITHVDAEFPDADVYFPQIDPKIWKAIKEEPHQKDELHAYNFIFTEYIRK